MKTLFAALMAGALFLGGCSTPIREPASAQSPHPKPVAGSTDSAADQRRRPPVAAAARQPPQQSVTAVAPSVSAPPEGPPITQPDAVVMLDPRSGSFSPPMESRLAKIAAEVNRDDRILIRLESYVPGGGSSALDIGIADRVLHKVRERLHALGVAPRRMLLASFGGEHSMERDPKRHWVEIYLIRPGSPSRQTGSGNSPK